VKTRNVLVRKCQNCSFFLFDNKRTLASASITVVTRRSWSSFGLIQAHLGFDYCTTRDTGTVVYVAALEKISLLIRFLSHDLSTKNNQEKSKQKRKGKNNNDCKIICIVIS
jgi:hypothetical protein